MLADRAQKAAMGPKVEVVYNLLTMLFSHDRHNVSQKLLHMSTNPETRSTLHQVGQYYSAQMSIYRTLLLIQFVSPSIVGCIPLLVQLIYNQDGNNGPDSGHPDRSSQSNSNSSRSATNSWMLTEADKETRASAAQALHNLVYNSCDDRQVKREIRILKLLELIRGYADRLRDAIMHQLHHHHDHQDIDHRLPLLLDGNDVGSSLS